MWWTLCQSYFVMEVLDLIIFPYKIVTFQNFGISLHDYRLFIRSLFKEFRHKNFFIMVAKLKLMILNISGVLYTALVCLKILQFLDISFKAVSTIAFINLYWTCPDVNEDGDCFWQLILSVIILVEIFINLTLFHYYNKRNQV